MRQPWLGECPDDWQIVSSWGNGFAYREARGGPRVLVDLSIKEDGGEWIHVSASRKQWTPTHEDMARVKSAFIGEQRYAYSVWSPSEVHVNIHPHCLHLWARLDESDGRVLPEFSAYLPLLGRSI